MKKKAAVFALWAALYALCVGMNFIAAFHVPLGWAKAPFVLVSLAFFIPPFYLLFLAKKDKEKKTVAILRVISIVALALFVVLFCLNLASVNWSPMTGRVLYYLFISLCAPVVCGQFYVLGLYLWACILMVTMKGRNRPGRK